MKIVEHAIKDSTKLRVVQSSWSKVQYVRGIPCHKKCYENFMWRNLAQFEKVFFQHSLISPKSIDLIRHKQMLRSNYGGVEKDEHWALNMCCMSSSLRHPQFVVCMPLQRINFSINHQMHRIRFLEVSSRRFNRLGGNFLRPHSHVMDWNCCVVCGTIREIFQLSRTHRSASPRSMCCVLCCFFVLSSDSGHERRKRSWEVFSRNKQ